jgi:hypothetical protein
MPQTIAAKLALAAAAFAAIVCPTLRADAAVYTPVTVETADYSYTSVLPGLPVPAPSGPIETLNPWALPSDVSVFITPSSRPNGAVSGSQSGSYSAPFTGANPDGSGEGAPITVPYWSTGDRSIEFDFTGTKSYFGMLWGSVDTYNSLTFYSGATQVLTLTGADVVNGFAPQGARSLQGARFLSVDFQNGGFDRVVASSSGYAFEFAAVSTSTAQQTILPDANGNLPLTFNPVALNEPASLAVLGMGFIGIAALVRRA